MALLEKVEAEAKTVLVVESALNSCPWDCKIALDPLVIQNKLKLLARKAVRTYYEGALFPADPTLAQAQQGKPSR